MFFLVMYFLTNTIIAQNNTANIVEGAPSVYVDCNWCDLVRTKRKVNFVNYVRQRQDADIYVTITLQSTGKGYNYTLYYAGQNDYSAINDTLYLSVTDSETDSEVEDKLIAKFKQGLLKYLVNSELFDKIDYKVAVENKDENSQKVIIDPWNSWVFGISARGSFSGQSNTRRLSYYSSISANKVTKKNKIGFYLSRNASERQFYIRDSNFVIIDSLTITTSRNSMYFSGKYIRALSEHLSAGVFTKAFKNTFSNYDLGLSTNLGLEYNFYDFADSDRKSLILTYKVGMDYNDYVDTTIYNKLDEILFSNSLGLNIYQKQKWGSLDFGASFFAYLHDIRINSLTFSGNVSWNIFKGFTFSLGGYLTFVNDQISLPKQEVGVIGTVLGDRLLATNYNAYTYVGLRYTFGSKYANVVNPRFSSGNSVTYYFY